MSTKRAPRFCKKCRRMTSHAFDARGRTCQSCGKHTPKETDAAQVAVLVTGEIKR